ncbi:hypothetical protein ILUMI_13967 [Ignelater luminosus]|uniref:Reverse transcriptase domain-containing protein n=1 Tax=Ignelater luminosus TaxID=2038154 RepID=A0A8K0CXG9_IGNLU|nr:hypothetical protein ILUMI_13967 [Ignelater luminosus]
MVATNSEKTRINLLNNTIENKKYDESRKLVKKKYRNIKREHIERKIQAIDNNYIKKQAKEFYKGINNEKRRNLQSKMVFCKNQNGKIEESLDRWAEYFQEVYESREKQTGDINEQAYTPAAEREDPPTQQGIAEIIRKLKNSEIMAYADDIVLMARTEDNLRNVFKKLENAAKDKGLIIKESKTKLIKIEKTPGTNESKKMKIVTEEKEYELEAVIKYNNLGVEVTNTGEEKMKYRRESAKKINTFPEQIEQNINTNAKLQTNDELEAATHHLITTIGEASWTATPKSRNLKANMPNLPYEITQLVKEKRRARAQWQRTHNIEDRRKFNQMSLPIKKFTKTEIKAEIKLLNNKKSPGYDLIDAIVLKRLPDRGIQFLQILFHAILRLSHWPVQLKSAEIILISKSEKSPDKINSYRPISLFPTISKWLEKLFLKRIRHDGLQDEWPPDHQFGDETSDIKQIRAGVPQRSVLGPFLYLLFTYDIPSMEQSSISTFADDTALLAFSDDPEMASSLSQRDLKLVEK